MTPNTKKEITESVAVVGIVVSIIVIIAFSWSPAWYVLGKWSNFWDNKSNPPTTESEDLHARVTAYDTALNDCAARAQKYYKTSLTSINFFASSTSDYYKTYDCYGIKYNKIPLTQ